jgi:hypothetical protein
MKGNLLFVFKEKLLKGTPPRHSDYAAVFEALHAIKLSALTNEGKRQMKS